MNNIDILMINKNVVFIKRIKDYFRDNESFIYTKFSHMMYWQYNLYF